MPMVIPYVTVAIAEAMATLLPIAATTAFALAPYVTTALLVGGSMAYSSAQNAKMRNAFKAATADKGRDIMSRDPLAARRYIYGEVRTTGPILFMSTCGVKNELLHIVTYLADHECEDLGEISLDTQEVVPLDGSGDAIGKYANYLHIDKHNGWSGQAADSDLLSSFPGVWTTDHILTGISYLHIRLRYNTELFPNGTPSVFCRVKGKKVFDPRDGTQDSADASTWKWSDNPPLCVADYMHDSRIGKGIAWSRIPFADLTEAANIADETITLLTGTEKRYALNGTVLADQLPDSVLVDMCTAMAGHVVEAGCYYCIRAGAYRTPTLTLSDADLIGSVSVVTRQSRRDNYNGVRGVFISPDNQWVATDFPPQKNDTYMSWDGGIRLWKDVAYGFTTSTPMAQRLAKIDLERGRQQITVEATYMLKPFELMNLDSVMLTRPVLGWSGKVFEVRKWTFQNVETPNRGRTLAIKLSLQETAAEVWDWNSGEETAVDLAPNTNLPDASVVATPTGLTVLTDSTTSIINPDGTFVPRAKLTWNLPNDTYVEQGGRTWIEYKLHADSVWLVWGYVPGDRTLEYLTDVKVGSVVDFRIYHENALNVKSNSSGTRTYNTVSSYTIAGDNAGPATPSGLSAAVGTGKAVSLNWSANTEPDLLGYNVYKATSNSFGAASQIATAISATCFVDINVTIGSTYYYFIKAVDDSGNVSSGYASSGAATPSYIGSGAIDPTAPSNTSAASNTGSGTYAGGNGVQFAYLMFSIPGLPSNATHQNFYYRRNGDAQWLLVGQYANSGTMTGVKIIGLATDTAYEVATLGFNAINGLYSSSVIAASGSPYTTPTAGAPAAPTSLSNSTSTYDMQRIPPAYAGAGGNKYAASMLHWTASTSRDVAYYELSQDGSGPITVFLRTHGTETECPIYAGLMYSYTNSAIRVRAVNTSGVVSSWSSPIGPFLSSSYNYGTQDMAEQAKSAIDVTGGKVILGGFEANQTTAVDIKGVNLRIYDGSGVQKQRTDNATGEIYIQGVKVLSTRQAAPSTLGDVIAAGQAHGLWS